MTALSALSPGTVSVLLRRLTRTQSVTWPRGRLYVPLALLALTGIAYATVAIYLHRPSDARV